MRKVLAALIALALSVGGVLATAGPASATDPVVVAVNLTYIQGCAPDGDNTWRVTNPSALTIQVSYAAYGGGPSGTISAPPGQSFFSTPRASETMIITWGGGATGIVAGSRTKASGSDLTCLTLVVPVAPTVVAPPSCGTYGSVTAATTTGVTYVVEFDQVTGVYTVTATPKAGYRFDGDVPQILFEGNAGAYTKCPDLPTLAEANPSYSFTQPTCTLPGTYTVGGTVNAEFIEWRMQGSSTIIPQGTPVAVGGAVAVTLVATSTDPIMYTLVDANSDPWVNPVVLTFVTPTNCGNQGGQGGKGGQGGTDLQLETLALTGGQTAGPLGVLGVLSLLAIGGLLLIIRRRMEA